MTAISLFDVLSRDSASGEVGESRASDRVIRFAAQLVEWSLAEWDRVGQYESDFTPTDWNNSAGAIEIERSIHALHEQWAAEAEQILSRVQRLVAAGHPVPKREALEDALGFTQARLKMTPENTAHVMEQVRQGQFVPAKELRDELRARLRA